MQRNIVEAGEMQGLSLVREGSCDLSPKGFEFSGEVPMDEAFEEFKLKYADLAFTLDELEKSFKFGITPMKYRAMVEYAKFLRRSDPKMKESKIRSKVAQKYNIQLA